MPAADDGPDGFAIAHRPGRSGPGGSIPCHAPGMSTRYARAVHARRVELRARRTALTGSHRVEMRSCLALSRLAATAETAAALARLAREVAVHIDAADRAACERFPARLAAAVDDVACAGCAAWTVALRPALQRIATERCLSMPPGWPRLPAGRPPALGVLPPPPVGAAGSVLAGAVDGAALWRVALIPLAVLPLLGLPALGGTALAPLAVGAGVAAVLVAGRSRRAGVERIRLRRHADEVLAATRAALDTDLGRRLLDVERTAGVALDAAVADERAAVDAELALLAADHAGSPGV